MAFNFKFPDVGEGITEGEIVKWKVKVGDSVKADEPIAEVETDKAIVDIPSPKAGVILKINHKEGETIKVGEVLVVIGEKGEKIEESAPKKDEHYTGSVVGFLEEAKEDFKLEKNSKKSSTKLTENKIRATPKIRRLAKQLKVNLKNVTPSGHEGRITEDDIKNSVKKGVKIEYHGKITRKEFKGVRKTIAKNMMEAHQITVPVTTMHDADVTGLWEVRAKEKVKAEKKGVKITFMPYIIKAVTETLKKHAIINSTLEQDELILKDYYHIGFAVDTDDGLIVPVIKDADKKSLLSIAKELADLSEKARARKLRIDEIKGGSFSITNLGSIGVRYFTPIINYPESAILGLGSIENRAVASDNDIKIRKILPLSLTFDHRIIDGAQASKFMLDLIKNLENIK
ncbi:MAG: dihydrolipoamide acetyltransferase family protein [Nanoarchaeota archaeon]